MELWTSLDPEVTKALRAAGYTVIETGGKWYETDCPITWDGSYEVGGRTLRSCGTELTFLTCKESYQQLEACLRDLEREYQQAMGRPSPAKRRWQKILDMF